MRRILKSIIGYAIQFLEYLENRCKPVYCEKFIDEHTIDIRVKTDTGFEHASEISKTKPFEVYEVVFDDGTRFECADNHKFFTAGLDEVLCRDLRKGDALYCDNGQKVVSEIIHHRYKFCMYDISMDTCNHRYYTSGVLSHNTISSSIYLAWYVLFNYDKTCFLTGNIEKTAVDILGKVQEVIKNVPFFMKPGINKWGSLECKFDNGCRLMGAATTKRAGIGFTIHCLYLDEFAHVDKGIIDEFFDNIYPTVSSLPDSKIIVTSTPNGMNRFYQIYDAATKGINSFAPFRIDWWQVPDWDKDNMCWKKRGKKWMDEKIADLGNGDVELGLERFGAQYGNSFLSTGNLLLGPNALKLIETDKTVFEEKHLPIFDDYEIDEAKYLKWKPDTDVDHIRKDGKVRLLSVDLSEGNGGDDLVINIFNMFVMHRDDWKNILTPSSISDYVGLEQVGIFAYNRMDLSQFSKMLYLLSHNVMDPENTRILLEWNAFGGEVLTNLKTVFGDRNNFDPSVVLRFKRSLDSDKLDYGLRINSDSKKILCQDCKRNIGIHRMVLHDSETVGQFNLFGKVKSSYAAITGHDDRVMTCIDANAFFGCRDFVWLADYVIESENKTAELLEQMREICGDAPVYGGLYGDISSSPQFQSTHVNIRDRWAGYNNMQGRNI